MVQIISSSVDLKTPTGAMRTYVYEPKSASRKYGGLILYSAIFQLQPTIARMAERFASQGFVVFVPEIFHSDLEIGTVLGSNDHGRDLGTKLKKTTKLSIYKDDLDVLILALQAHPKCNGNLGAAGFCVGGHIALLAALNPFILSSACFFATDIVTGTLGSEDGSTNTLSHLTEIKGEVAMIWGRQDPHVPDDHRRKIYAEFQDAKINYTWHEFNADHSFMMDEDGKGRSDPSVARLCYDLVFDMFHRTL